MDNKGYVYVAHSKDDSNKHCCLFWEFTDYLAYLSIQKKHFLNLPKDCDCFIMSDVRNFIPMVVDTDDYENIYMFFPNNDTGYTIAKTIQNRNSKHVHDCSLLYAANETLHDLSMPIWKKSTNKGYNSMKILCIALGVVIIAIAIAFIYEIKHTYRDGDLWKMNESSAFMRLLKVIYMIDNVFTIIHCKNGLEKTPEYWQKADFEEKFKELTDRVIQHKHFTPTARMKIIRKMSF